MARKKKLQDLKKSKDVYFRKRAKQQALDPVTDLNTEIRQKPKNLKGTKGQIQSQKNYIKELEKKNREINKQKKDLEKRWEFEDEEGRKKIEEELRKPEYVRRNLSGERNQLKALQGKEFNFIVDDGFKRYKLNTKELKKYWKKGQDASLPILKKMEKNAEKSIKFYDNLIKKEKNTATKSRLKKLKRIRDGLNNKLIHTIRKNIQVLETGNTKYFDEVNEYGEKAYSLLFKVVGPNIDRIGI